MTDWQTLTDFADDAALGIFLFVALPLAIVTGLANRKKPAEVVKRDEDARAYQLRPNPDAPVTICLRCGALVDWNAADLHDEWHTARTTSSRGPVTDTDGFSTPV